MGDELKPTEKLEYGSAEVPPVPDTFWGWLEAVRARPGVYLGSKSLRDFDAWLRGFRFGANGSFPDEEEFYGFNAFVCDKFCWHDTGGWAAKIAYNYRDDAEAFNQFFALLDEYRSRQNSHPVSGSSANP